MFIELHILQNFAPSNLNRDDTGAPKDCEFGGYRRARISSQCLKRAIRTSFKAEGLVPAEHLATRTKRVVDALSELLAERGRAPDEAKVAAGALLAQIKPNLYDPKTEKTQYLMFLAKQEIEHAATLCEQYWESLLAAGAITPADEDGGGRAGRGRKPTPGAASAVPSAAKAALERWLDGGRAADLALFGRMLADLPEHNVDAACQVAHAISTNRVSMEMDFYTAVDDLKPEDTAGADMLGTVEFNSACFYRYANVDLAQLSENLGSDKELAHRTLAAFLRAAVLAVPTGKQNSMAAQNPPSLVFAVARKRGLWSLANAFVQPVRPTPQRDLVQGSIERLDVYWSRLTQMYGQGELVGSWVCLLEDGQLEHLSAAVTSVEALVDSALATASFEPRSADNPR